MGDRITLQMRCARVWARYKKWEAKRLFFKAMKLDPTPFTAYMNLTSRQRGQDIANDFLDKRGIPRCFKCPSNISLRKTRDIVHCVAHKADALRHAVLRLNQAGKKESANV